MNFNIITLGCKVNQYESQAMREDMITHGYTLSDDKDIADIIQETNKLRELYQNSQFNEMLQHINLLTKKLRYFRKKLLTF